MELFRTDDYLEALRTTLLAHYPKGAFCLTGYQEWSVCLQYERGVWHVFYGERGNRYEEAECDTVLQACLKMLRYLTHNTEELSFMENELIANMLWNLDMKMNAPLSFHDVKTDGENTEDENTEDENTEDENTEDTEDTDADDSECVEDDADWITPKGSAIKLRFEEETIIDEYMYITGNTDKKKVFEILMQSPTFRAVHRGNPCALYDGSSANLISAVDEIKSTGDYPEEFDLITVSAMRGYYCYRRNLAKAGRKWIGKQKGHFFTPEYEKKREQKEGETTLEFAGRIERNATIEMAQHMVEHGLEKDQVISLLAEQLAVPRDEAELIFMNEVIGQDRKTDRSN